ncbi:ArsB/NhaD family transporter [Pendulispora albinea]|uniref:Anion permease n=1 Tax=Pendulispora albinea TaxID=2741071 RepID=A0ABZ2LXN4_9BACT
MDEAVAYSTLAVTVTLAVSRPRVGLRGLRFTPGAAALVGVAVLFMAGLLRLDDMRTSAQMQWRPLAALTSIMILTGVVQEVGAFERLAQRIESYAHRTSAARAFGLVFLVSVVTPSLLNNDSAILLLTPLVIALTRRLYPGRPALTEAFAFAVFLAPGVAPFVISNPMNMIVAEFAGVGFNAYAAVMLPISVAGAILTYAVLRGHFRHELESAVAEPAPVSIAKAHPAERPAMALLLAVFLAYPVMAALGGPIWVVSVAGAASSLALAWHYRIAPARKVLGHVSPDILVFLWGVFLVVGGLRHVGVVDRLAALYQSASAHAGSEIGVIGTVAALGSAIVDNHPMSILNMMALREHGAYGAHDGSRAILAALIGGDIGPRLLPIGSLAGLLWMDLLRRAGVAISIGKFIRLGTLVLLPTLALSLAMLYFLA